MSGSAGFDEPKAAESATVLVSIFDFGIFPISPWNFDGPGPSRQVLSLLCDLTVELRQHPKEPVQIAHNYFRYSFAPIFAEWLQDISLTLFQGHRRKIQAKLFRACKLKLACS